MEVNALQGLRRSSIHINIRLFWKEVPPKILYKTSSPISSKVSISNVKLWLYIMGANGKSAFLMKLADEIDS